jgi:hypothetical protein
MPVGLNLVSSPGIPPYVAKRVDEILQQEQMVRFLPEAAQHRVRIEAILPAGVPLAAAHANWQTSYFPKVLGLPPFASQPASAVTPPGVVRVACECVVAPSGGMSSYYGFAGYFVSLLVCIPEACIWDARVDEAK